MVGSKKTRGKTAAMAQSTTGSDHHDTVAPRQSHPTAEIMARPHGTAPPPLGPPTGNTILTCAATLQQKGPSAGSAVPPPRHLAATTTSPQPHGINEDLHNGPVFDIVPSQGPMAESSHLHGAVDEHGGTSHQGGLTTTTDLGPILEQLQAFPPLPPRSTHTPAYTSNETLARVQLGSTHFSPLGPRSQVNLNQRVDQLTRRMDNQNDLMRQVLSQINLALNLGLGQQGEERRMDERAYGQFDENQAS
ncbi:unnamed protein product [Prunus armeniaca]